MENKPKTSLELREQLFVAKTPCVVSFSGGKDAIATVQSLIDSQCKIADIFYLYTVPDLSFVEEHLKKCENWLGMPILRLPHPSLIRMLKNTVFQEPKRYRLSHIVNYKNEDIDKWVQKTYKSSLQCLGVRVNDSLNRRAAYVRFGAHFNEKRKTCWPIFDWNTSQVVDAVRRSGVGLPVDYRMFGRSFDGIHFQYLAPIAHYFPEDFERICYYFPLARLEFMRRHNATNDRSKSNSI